MKTTASFGGTTRPKILRLADVRTTRWLPLLLLMLSIAAQAQEFAWANKNGAITIAKYTGPGGTVTIPTNINNGIVTIIGDQAFQGCSSLTSVTVGNSVTNIGQNAFADCRSLTNITIPESVIAIEWGAFLGCRSLVSLNISKSVKSIGSYALDSCHSLSAITVDPLNSSYSSAEGVLFNKSQTILIKCPVGKAGRYTIPGTVTSIQGSAFADCWNLTSVTIPNSVTNLDWYAFTWCRDLKEVHFQGNAPSLGSQVFHKADKATIYYLPGTTGWGTTFGGRPTAVDKPSPSPPR